MYRPKDHKERILHRLRIAKGHLEKIIQMAEDNTYCIHILHQLNAVETGLKETGHAVMENHLKTCVADAIGKGKKEEVVKEVMEVLKRK